MSKRIKGITIELDGETKGLDKALSDVNKRSRDVAKELRDVERLLKFNPGNTELVAQKQKLLGDQVEATRDKLNQLKNSQDQVTEAFKRGEISEDQYRAFQREIVETESKLKHFEGQLQQSQSKLKEFGETVGKAGESMKKTGDNLTTVGKGLSTKVTAPIAGVGAAATVAADKIDKAYREIRIGTGATGEAFEDLKNSFDTVFAQVPDDAEAVGSALANLNTYTGWTGEVLEGLTKKVMDAARTMGEDGVAASEAYGIALNNWNIPADEAEAHLDHLYNLTQTYGVGLAQISELTTKHGTALKNAGFEMDEVAHWMATLEANGISVTRIMPGLNKATRDWAEEGKNAKEELDKVITSMQNATTDAEALAIATETFGAQGAQRMTDAVRNGALPAISDLGSMFEQSTGIIAEATDDTRTMGEEFQILKNNAMTALEPVGKIILEVAKDLLPQLVEMVKQAAEWFRNLSPEIQKTIVVIGAIVAAVGPLLVVLGTMIKSIGSVLSLVSSAIAFLPKLGAAFTALTGPIGIIIAVIAALIAIGVAVYKNWETIKELAIEIWTSIAEFFTNVWDGVKETIETIWDNLVEFLVSVWEGIKETASTIWSAIVEAVMAVIQPFIDGVINIFDNMKDGLQRVLDGLKQYFSGVWDLIKNIFLGAVLLILNLVTGNFEELRKNAKAIFENIKKALGDIWEGIKKVFSGALDAIWGFVKGAWENIKTNTTTIFNGIKNTITNIWNGIKTFFTQTLQNIWNTVRQKFSDILNSVRDQMRNVKDTIQNIMNEAINFLRNINLFDIGKDIITGLVNGIGSMASAVWNKATEIANGIGDSIKSALRIASPSKVMIQFGEWTGEGLAVGLESMFSKLKNLSAKMGDLMIPSMPKIDGVGSAGNVTGTTNVLNLDGMLKGANFHVRNDNDVKEIVKEIWRMVQQQNRGSGGARE